MSAPSNPARSSISEVHEDRVVVRGLDLCGDLIGRTGFTAYFLFLLTGERPGPTLTGLTDAALVAIAEHGFVPSVQAARMTLAAAPEALQGAVAAGLLGCGSVILGASEEAGRLLVAVRDAADARGGDLDAAARDVLARERAAGRKLAGFGHPQHRRGDPRAKRLIAVAAELGVDGPHMAALSALERHVEAVYGRWLPANVSAAIPAVLLDAGFPAGALKGIPMLARCAALIAHLAEEVARPIGFRLADAAAGTVVYDPPAASA